MTPGAFKWQTKQAVVFLAFIFHEFSFTRSLDCTLDWSVLPLLDLHQINKQTTKQTTREKTVLWKVLYRYIYDSVNSLQHKVTVHKALTYFLPVHEMRSLKTLLRLHGDAAPVTVNKI